jgi:hypothetical protein
LNFIRATDKSLQGLSRPRSNSKGDIPEVPQGQVGQRLGRLEMMTLYKFVGLGSEQMVEQYDHILGHLKHERVTSHC